MERPIYTLIAGVNGAGKSTLYLMNAISLPEHQIRVNADEIARQIGDFSDPGIQFLAGKKALETINACIENRISFNQETTLCGTNILHNILQAAQNGFSIHLYYIGVDSFKIATERVANRVLHGGHGISNHIIQRRYRRSLEKLQRVLPLCNKAIFLITATNLF